MLNRAGYHVCWTNTGPDSADKSQVVGFSPAAGEDNFVGVGIEQSSNLCPCLLHGFPCNSSFSMLA